VSIKIDKLQFGLEEKVTILGKKTVSLQSYHVVASRPLGGDFVGGEMVWWRDD